MTPHHCITLMVAKERKRQKESEGEIVVVVGALYLNCSLGLIAGAEWGKKRYSACCQLEWAK